MQFHVQITAQTMETANFRGFVIVLTHSMATIVLFVRIFLPSLLIHMSNSNQSACESSTHGIIRLSDTSYQYASVNKDFIGYIQAKPELAYLGITTSVTGSTDQVTVYTQKSCYPQPSSGLYDNLYVSSKGASNGTVLAKDCSEIDGGVWYVRVVCPRGSCSFSISVGGNQFHHLND